MASIIARPLRVSTLAKELGLPSRTVMECIWRLGITDIKTPSSRIEDPIFADALRAHLKNYPA